jgi:DNA-directed RNA polymerase specialized sigma24 family protein
MAEDAFEAVVAAHHAEIRRYLLRVTARASDADDLSQETFLRAFRAYRVLPAGANVRAWLFTIATNLGRNHFRAQSRRRCLRGGGPRDESTRRSGPTARCWPTRRARGWSGRSTGCPASSGWRSSARKMHELEYAEIEGEPLLLGESARAHVFQALRKVRRSLDGHLPGMESR